MSSTTTQAQISCPNCGTPIDVNKVLLEKVRTEIGQEYENTIAKERETLAAEKKQVEAAQKEVDAKVEAAVLKQVADAKKEQEVSIRKKLTDEQDEAMKTLHAELDLKSKQVQELNQTKALLAQEKREKAEQADKIKAEAEAAFTVLLIQEQRKTATLKEAMDAQKQELQKELGAQLATAKKEQEVSIRTEMEEGMKTLQVELDQKSQQVKELNQTKALLAKAQREKDELAEKLKADLEVQLNERLAKAKTDISKTEADKQELKLKERDELIDKMKSQMAEMQRRAEQGSMQSQGEVQELAIEEWLRTAFPLDTVEEISKGVRGGDCIHRVFDRSGQELGAIYYESKRTKAFTKGWIGKLKQDMQAAKTHVGVIVTEAMPTDMERMGQREGLWICTYEEFKALCYVLRDMMMQVGHAISTQQNKGDKMEMLYNYLTGSEFHMHIEAIVKSYTKQKTDIASERRVYERIWKEREKNLELVIANTAQLYGSIRGIAGNAIGPVASLELGEGNSDM